MRLLAVPNWSFGRETSLLRHFREILSHDLVTLHYCEANIDHNRTVTAFSGEDEVVVDMIMRLAMACFDTIDLSTQVGVYPRIGALDVCPFVIPELPARQGKSQLMQALAVAENAAGMLAATFDLPIFLYEKSERGRHEADLPSLRQGGYSSLQDRALKPDFGPSKAHPRLGVTVLGVRDPLISFNINLETDDLNISSTLARLIRQLRNEGDERFLGVRVMSLPLLSKGQTQLNLTLTLPDLMQVDAIIEWAHEKVSNVNVKLAGTELVGVIRDRDLHSASRLTVKPAQVLGS